MIADFKEFLVRRFIDLSTGHITKRDNDLLEQLSGSHDRISPDLMTCGVIVEAKDQGWVVWQRHAPVKESVVGPNRVVVVAECGCWKDNCESYKWRDNLISLGFSLAFVELLQFASANSYGLWLDADAPDYNELPMFDWQKEKEVGHPVLDEEKGL